MISFKNGISTSNTGQSLKPTQSNKAKSGFTEMLRNGFENNRLDASPKNLSKSEKPLNSSSIEVLVPKEVKDQYKNFLYGITEVKTEENSQNPEITELLSQLSDDLASKIEMVLNGEFGDIADNDSLLNSEDLLAMIASFVQSETNGDKIELSENAFIELQQIISDTFGVKFDVTHDKFSTLLSDINKQFPKITRNAESKETSKLNNISNMKIYQMVTLEEQQLLQNELKQQQFESHISKLKQLVANVAEEISHTNLDKGTANHYLNQMIRKIITDSTQTNSTSIELAELENFLAQQLPVSGIKPELNKSIDQKALLLMLSDATETLNIKINDLDVLKPITGIESTTMSKLEQFVIHVGQGQSLNQSQARSEFIQQFYEIVSAGKFRAGGNGHSQMVIKFKPDHLGSVIVKLSQINGEFTAKIITASNSARELLESNITQLRALLSAQNISVDKLEMYSQEQYSDLMKDAEQSNKDQQNDTARKNESDSIEEEDTFSGLLEEIVNLQV
ncbi:flagellar hook-length control protein FliK [Litchfieldia salsa]|uniref:Hook-length control protein FliK n=1 Tax=Litchfieldia salsa TaxID=930152 RepID=A0A1H0R788_9BACI|nr:flagellar hook-length control protein FliK [Litchfieldia salsa]SDP25361.1 hook-length control protein FliK [Litchfieldia salsa]